MSGLRRAQRGVVIRSVGIGSDVLVTDTKAAFDDGTATAVLAALINAAKAVRLSLDSARVGVIGLGAAGTAIASLLRGYGIGDVFGHDPDPIAATRGTSVGARMVMLTNLLQNSQVIIAATGCPGMIKPGHVRPGQIIFALSTPDPEIDPRLALESGAAIALDGRTINSSLAFPSLVRAVIETRARAITSEMMIEAARTIASRARPTELVPSSVDRALHDAVTAAVARCARETGMANTASP